MRITSRMFLALWLGLAFVAGATAAQRATELAQEQGGATAPTPATPETKGAGEQPKDERRTPPRPGWRPMPLPYDEHLDPDADEMATLA